MVGIGSGVPSPKNYIRLRDLVIGVPNANHGGVLQYDLGQSAQRQGFQLIMSFDSPPPVLLTAVTALKVKYDIATNGIVDAIITVLEKNPNLWKEFQPQILRGID
ncbi:hypothetical protein PENSUB_2642 [Penicillium subrubescens]|uniref:Uncharacterized protein n=2 Tax=Penicillium subrubescens TaxID=1316194 RepID=A0A1Q5UH16_9EURO|nr:hypothetical protein PENSUB_2642 [Penicillium subrubescens]